MKIPIMIRPRMPRPLKVILVSSALAAVALLSAACGSQNISVSKSDQVTHTGAVLFSQRCAGCHTLSYAGTQGSAAYVRDAQPNNGPNFNVRCERPVTRVLYAIVNGGYSGAYMPQNIVVGAQARAVAQFVAQYAGRQAPSVPGVPTCQSQPIGTLPPPALTTLTTTGTTAPPATKSKTAVSARGHKRAKGNRAPGAKIKKKTTATR